MLISRAVSSVAVSCGGVEQAFLPAAKVDKFSASAAAAKIGLIHQFRNLL
jgi:hypothetical protein